MTRPSSNLPFVGHEKQKRTAAAFSHATALPYTRPDEQEGPSYGDVRIRLLNRKSQTRMLPASVDPFWSARIRNLECILVAVEQEETDVVPCARCISDGSGSRP
jgi:hypothetical protein